jgi:hypothetical protein
LAFTSAVFAQGGNGGTAVPAGTASFDNGNCTAKFVRSASGIINETNRVCQPGDLFAGAYLQFRPVSGTPNPNCDPDGLLVPQFTFENTEGSISPWFGSISNPKTYNVCVYLVKPTQIGTIDSSNPNGATATLPANGRYSVCVSGTYSSSNHVGDAEYVTTDDWATPGTDGLTNEWSILGTGFGDVQINNSFVDWGEYNSNHSYCTTVNGTKGSSLNLRVFDGYANTNQIVADWYGDNSGSLGYVVKFLGY